MSSYQDFFKKVEGWALDDLVARETFTIEELYQAFKDRLLNEVIAKEWDIGGCSNLINIKDSKY